MDHFLALEILQALYGHPMVTLRDLTANQIRQVARVYFNAELKFTGSRRFFTLGGGLGEFLGRTAGDHQETLAG